MPIRFRNASLSHRVRLFGSSTVTPTYSSRQKTVTACKIDLGASGASSQDIEHAKWRRAGGEADRRVGFASDHRRYNIGGGLARRRRIAEDREVPVFVSGAHACLVQSAVIQLLRATDGIIARGPEAGVSSRCPRVGLHSAWEVNLATRTRTLIDALNQVDEWVGPHGVPGVGVAVWRKGEILAEHYAGEARAGVPVTQETLFPLASVTKPVTAATFMTLVDEGAVSLDEPVGGSYRISALDPQQVRKESIRRSSACARRSAPGSSSAMYPAYRKIWGPARRCIETEPQSTV